VEKVVIKKYENRRLYDTTHSKYVNLDEVAQMVRQGANLQVVDAKSGEDLTRSILTQIIVDESRGDQAGLPIDLLKQIILTTDQARHQFLEWYLKAAIDAYQKMQERVREFPGLMNPFDPATNPLWNLFRGGGAPGSAPLFGWPLAAPQQTAAPPAAPSSEVEELKRRIEELEKQIHADRSATAKKKKKKDRTEGAETG
jgi:polyhydroxyalkanoate synthesis repressor PhaR